jgi:hypothetical protein
LAGTDPESLVQPETTHFATVHLAEFMSLRAALTWRRLLARTYGEVEGLRWAKALTMLGAGERGGFAVGLAAVHRQLLIASWRSQAQFESFHAESSLAAAWDRDCSHAWHVLMHPTRTKGSFCGLVPFGQLTENGGDGPISVLTLGRCRWWRLASFTREGMSLTTSILQADGLITALTAGFPVTGNATFSLWEDTKSMLDFAYGQKGTGHRATVDRDSRLGILQEQITVRFLPHEIRGTWDVDMPGSNTLERATAEVNGAMRPPDTPSSSAEV